MQNVQYLNCFIVEPERASECEREGESIERDLNIRKEKLRQFKPSCISIDGSIPFAE